MLGFSSYKEPVFYQQCKKIIQDIMSESGSFYFYRPVDPVKDGAPDYYSIIDKPMSFFDIQEKLDKKLYKTPNEFINDVRTIWRNAKLYNSPEHTIYKIANDLSKKFEVLSGSLPREITEGDKLSKLQLYVELRTHRYLLSKESHQ